MNDESPFDLLSHCCGRVWGNPRGTPKPSRAHHPAPEMSHIQVRLSMHTSTITEAGFNFERVVRESCQIIWRDGVRDSYAARAVCFRHSAIVLRCLHRAIEGGRQQLQGPL